MRKIVYTACFTVMAFLGACSDDATVGNPGGGIAGEVLATSDSLSSNIDMKQYHSITAYGSVYGDGIVERGFVWATTDNPTLENSYAAEGGTGAGTFQMLISGLTAGTTYNIRPYGKKSDGSASYGSVRSAATVPYLSATVTSVPDLTAITVNATIANGLPNLEVTERGICWSTAPNPQTTGTKIKAPTAGKGSFSLLVEDLPMVTKFYVVAYAVSSEGTLYGPVHEVSTVEPTPAFFKSILEVTGLRYGVARDADGMYAAHFSFNIASDTDETKSTVTITYISPDGERDAQHVTRTLTYNDDYSRITWDAVNLGNLSFDGIARTGTSLDGLSGSGLSLDKPLPDSEINKIFRNRDNGGYDRVSEGHHGPWPSFLGPLWYNNNQGANRLYSLIEVNPGQPGIMAQWVFQGDTGLAAEWQCLKLAGVPVAQNGKVTFYDGGSLGWGDAGRYTTFRETCREWIDGLICNPQGVDFIMEKPLGAHTNASAANAVDQGDFFYYLISSDGKYWQRFKFRAYGQ